MARAEPRFIDHSRAWFADPMSKGRQEHDHRETDDCAEQFNRAAKLLGEERARNAKEPEMTNVTPVLPKSRGAQETSMNRPAQSGGVQVRERSGIWEVQVEGKFRGDYHQKEHALAAAALLKLSSQ